MMYLTVDELLAIHLEAIRELGGAAEILDFKKLESSLETPRQTMFGEDLYPDLVSKAAILFVLVIKNHPFMDGNKRTATLALLEFLERNGHRLESTNDELYQFAIDAATSVLDKDQVANWIRARLQAA